MVNNYKPFDKFVLRSPLLSFDKFASHLSEISNSEEMFKNLFRVKLFQEAIFIASPILFEELIKYLDIGLPNKSEEDRLKYSLIRYLSRMSTRCTPFGIFSGCSLGHIGIQTDIELVPKSKYRTHTRLDMMYLCELAQEIAKQTSVKQCLNYYPNSSIYKLGAKIRYVEYFYNNSRRFHRISVVDNSEYLEKVLLMASTGARFKELSSMLVDSEITIDEASEFIDELITSQLLVSNLEPNVTGKEFLPQIIQELKTLRNDYETEINKIVERLERINNLLITIDSQSIDNRKEIYESIISEIKNFETKFELKFLFQTDMVKPVKSAILNQEIVNDIIDASLFLNKISINPSETVLSKFGKAFYDRYEDREMPLLQVLDNESGIGYRQDGIGDKNPLVDDLVAPIQEGKMKTIMLNIVQSEMLKKYLEAKNNQSYTIELSDKDFEYLKARWDDLPATISAMFEVIKETPDSREIYLKLVGGSSATSLLGRFCHADNEIEDLVLQIVKKEEEVNPEVINAEVVHLPESRMGNVIIRPVLRLYEIPFLAKSAVKKKYQIELADLMISFRNNKIILRSKRLNKEIIPRLSSAHNYASVNAMPIYHFLGDIQLQNKRSYLGFDWGPIANEYNWLPRVTYKNIIISRAKWTVKKDEVKMFFKISEGKVLIESITKWRQPLRIPKYVILVSSDNELFVDLENVISIRAFLILVKNLHSFNLEEFLFDIDNSIVRSEDGVFRNEIILSFHKYNLNDSNPN